MRVDRGLVFALGAAVFTAACASAGAGGGSGATPGGSSSGRNSLPQVQCNGAVPAATQYATAAQDALNRTLISRGTAATPLYQTALEQSRQGIAADASNPYHYFLAGEAYVGLDQLPQADSMFTRTVELCPAFQAEVEPIRRDAFGRALQAGNEALQRGDTATALASWTRATEIYQGDPGAVFNLALVYSQSRDAARAGQYAREALAIIGRMPADTSAQVMAEREETRTGAIQLLFNSGVAAFQANNFQQAAEIFRGLTELDKNYREAWTNYTFSLYKQDRWADVIPVAQQLLTLDPLNENAMLVLAQAFRELNRGNEGVAIRERLRDAPVYVTDLALRSENNQAVASGKVVGNAARAGTPIRLLVTFSTPKGDVGTQTVNVAAPAKGESTPFEARLDSQARVTSFRYQVQP